MPAHAELLCQLEFRADGVTGLEAIAGDGVQQMLSDLLRKRLAA
jgi:hypothetical protein